MKTVPVTEEMLQKLEAFHRGEITLPPEITLLKEEIEGDTRALEVRTLGGEEVTLEDVAKIVAKKKQLDGLYLKFLQGTL